MARVANGCVSAERFAKQGKLALCLGDLCVTVVVNENCSTSFLDCLRTGQNSRYGLSQVV